MKIRVENQVFFQKVTVISNIKLISDAQATIRFILCKVFQWRGKTKASVKNREPNVDIANKENLLEKHLRGKRRYTQGKKFQFLCEKKKN